MGVLKDGWMEQDKNDEEWLGDFHMWRKRVLMTHRAGQAWHEMCKLYGFAAAAHKVGMLMTIDRSSDDLTID